MKIAVVEFAARGGLIQYAFQLCRALADSGAGVVLITDRHYELAQLPHRFRVDTSLRLWDPKPAGRISLSRAARVARSARRIVRAAAYQAAWVRTIAVLRRERPDIVQFGDFRFASDLVWLRLLRALGFTLADICHNVLPFASGGSARVRASALTRSAYRTIYRQFVRVFVHHESNRTAFLSAFDLPPERVVAIPHGNEEVFAEVRDPSCTAESLRRRLGLTADTPVVLLFGTLAGYKGCDALIEAFTAVVERVPNARLVIAGYPAPGFDLAGHRALAARLGLADVVTFVPGYIETPHTAAWMDLATVVALPYHTIFQSGAAMLAQTFGVPVVATRVGSMAESIRDGETGLIVPPGDRGGLAAALISILRDPELQKRMGDAGRRHARVDAAWAELSRIILTEYSNRVAARAEAAKNHVALTENSA